MWNYDTHPLSRGSVGRVLSQGVSISEVYVLLVSPSGQASSLAGLVSQGDSLEEEEEPAKSNAMSSIFGAVLDLLPPPKSSVVCWKTEFDWSPLPS